MAHKTKGKHARQAQQGELALQVDAQAALYIRVSTELQAERGTSLDEQRKTLTAYCEKNGYTVMHVYEDAGISGKSTDRPQFQAMMQAANDGKVKRVIATKLDRIARNLKDLLETVDQLNKSGCALIVLDQNFDTSTPSGKFFLQMMGAIAELERSMISERVMSGKRNNASKGTFNGARIPYGYTYSDGVFTVNEQQAAVVRNIFQRFLAGETLIGIANSLNDAGIDSPGTKPPKDGEPPEPPKSWTHGGVRHMLDNRFYAGYIEWGDAEDYKNHKGAHPVIIDPETFDKVKERLAKSIGRGRPKTKE